MKFVFVRHGETFENKNNISQGQSNSQLTPEGINQAKKVAEKLKDFKFDFVYSSDLDRTMDTCKEILVHHPDLEIKKEKILREQAKGICEGMTIKEKDKLISDSGLPYEKWKPEGGESLEEVWNKIVPFFESLTDKHSEKDNVLVVGHGGSLSCVFAAMGKKPIKDFLDFLPRQNTAVSILNIENGLSKFEVLNDASHLE
jgi:phosphoserine phosphatase